MYKLKYQGVFDIPEGDGTCVITLTDMNEKRSFAVLAERKNALELKDHFNTEVDTSRRLVDVLCRMIGERWNDYYIRLEGMHDRGFKTFLCNQESGTEVPIHPDEAVLLSQMAQIEICASLETFQKYSMPFDRNVQTVALPILGLPNSLLEKALEKAVSEENYESASFIRDEINRRKKEATRSTDDLPF